MAFHSLIAFLIVWEAAYILMKILLLTFPILKYCPGKSVPVGISVMFNGKLAISGIFFGWGSSINAHVDESFADGWHFTLVAFLLGWLPYT